MYSKPAHCYPFNELPVVKSLPRKNVVSTTPTNANFSKISSLLNIERQSTRIKSVNMEKKLDKVKSPPLKSSSLQHHNHPRQTQARTTHARNPQVLTEVEVVVVVVLLTAVGTAAPSAK